MIKLHIILILLCESLYISIPNHSGSPDGCTLTILSNISRHNMFKQMRVIALLCSYTSGNTSSKNLFKFAQISKFAQI